MILTKAVSTEGISGGRGCISIYLPSLGGGGAEQVMVGLANGIAARGHRVDLVLAKAEGPYLSDVSGDVRIIDLGKGRVLTSLPSLVRYLRRERPKAMIAALNHANIIAILARMLASSPMRLIVSERSSPSGARHNVATNVIHLLMRVLYPYADGIVAVSRGVADELCVKFNLPSERVVTIHNPLDLDRIRDLSAKRPNHPWLIAGAPPVVLAVGRLAKEKDYPTLLRAFSHLRESRSARLIILGEGALEPELRQIAASLGVGAEVDFVGFQRNPFGWMAASAVYVLSSSSEGFPNSLLQAMACGARVVSTDCPHGPREILEGGRWGALVPVKDVRKLSAAIGAELDSVAAPKSLTRARAFSSGVIVDMYLQEILGTGK